VGDQADIPVIGWRDEMRAIGSVVMMSTADYNAQLWTNKQHIASRIATELPVMYVESLGLRRPRLNGADVRRMARRLARTVCKAKDEPTLEGRPYPRLLEVVSPIIVPVHEPRLIRKANRTLLQYQIGRHLKALPRPRVLWTYTPLAMDLMKLDDFDFRLYHCVDDLGSIPGISTSLISDLEQRLAPAMDAVVTTSRALHDRLSTLNSHTHYFHNVVDADHFAQARRPGVLPPDLAMIPEPRAIFVGALSDHKIDWSLLADVARLLPEWSFVMIGPIGEETGQHGHELVKHLPNVHLLGHRPYNELPDYLRGGVVGMIPYRITEHTTSIFPMKALEYLAAGLPVVSTPLPAFSGHQDLLVAKAPDALSFSKALAAIQRTTGDDSPPLTAPVRTWDDLLAKIASLIRASLDE
jgi:glycosyltransferase involved in cell wall biosynthesis